MCYFTTILLNSGVDIIYSNIIYRFLTVLVVLLFFSLVIVKYTIEDDTLPISIISSIIFILAIWLIISKRKIQRIDK